MQRLIVNGDPGIRKGAVIEVGGEEWLCLSVTRNGDYHGPDRVQLSCLIGTDNEVDAYERREFIPHFLDVTAIDAEEVTVITPKGQLAG